MAYFVPLPTTLPRGSYVVAGPLQTGAMGDILRASFVPGKDMTDDLGRLLACLDQPNHER